MCRNRVPLVLRYHPETLRIPYHVETNAENHQVHVCGIGAIEREFHLYLPGVESIYAGCAGVQAIIHPRLSRTFISLPSLSR